MMPPVLPQVFRMVVSVPYEEEPDTGGGPEDCWASPKFFLDVKKGQSEDHAIFLANMFLGLGYDTYLAVGRNKVTKGGGEDDLSKLKHFDGAKGRCKCGRL